MARPGEPGQVPGVKIVAPIGNGTLTSVYEGRQGENPIAVKMPVGRAGLAPDYVRERFHRLALRHATVAHPAVVPIIEVGTNEEGTPYAITPLVTSTRLSRLLQESPPPEPLVLALAQTICEALLSIHEKGLFHGDVKPQNIVMERGSEGLLIDPDLAWPRVKNVEASITDLMYSAPERLGISDEPIDDRSDLYSLGAVLYHASTGTPPFRATLQAELLRGRLEESPRPAQEANPHLSPAFAAILDKLLQPLAENRYQSAGGLLHDLSHLKGLSWLLQSGRPFELDPTVQSGSFHPISLVNRHSDLDRILGALRKAGRDKEGSVQLIEGKPGTGKSRLALGASRAGRRSGATVLSTKCYENEEAPYSELRRIIGKWLSHDVLFEEGRPTPQEALVEAADGLSPYLTRFSPALADILPDHPGPPLVPAREHVESSVAELLLRIANLTGPLMIVLENVQWISASTANVLAHAAPRIREAPLLVVLTGNTPDVHVGASVRYLRRLRSAGLSRIRLTSLDESASRLFVARMLGRYPPSNRLASRLLEKGDGNPLVLRECISALLDARVMRPKDGRWVAEEAGMNRLLGEPFSEIMTKRRQRLPGKTQELLFLASAAGPCAHADVLTKAMGLTKMQTRLLVAEASGSTFLVRDEVSGYSLSHEIIRHELYNRLPEEERKLLHLRLAGALEEVKDHREQIACKKARQYSLAGEKADPRKTLASAYSAGVAALQAKAYEEARDHVLLALSTLSRMDPHSHVLRTLLTESLAEVHYHTGELEKARESFQSIIGAKSTKLQRARAHGRLSDINLLEFRTREAWQEIEKALATLGKPARAAMGQSLRYLGYRAVGRLLLASGMRRRGLGRKAKRRDRLLLDLYLRGAQVSYLSLRRDRLHAMRLAAIEPALRLGLSPAQVAVFAHQGLLLSSLGKRKSKKRMERADRLSRELSDPAAIAQVTALRSRAASQMGHSKEVDRLSGLVMKKHGPWLDTKEYFFTVADLIWNLEMRGYARRAREVMRQIFLLEKDPVGRTVPGVHQLPKIGLMGCLAVMGQSKAARFHLEQVELTMHDHGDPFLFLGYLGHKLLMHRELRELGKTAEDTIAEFERFQPPVSKLPIYLRLFHVVRTYVRMDQCQTHVAARRHKRRDKLLQSVEELEAAASIPIFRAHALVGRAAHDRLLGKHKRAKHRLEKAEAIADSIDAPWVIFEAGCERARLLAAEDNTTAAKRTALGALVLARRQGWRPRARRARAEFRLTEEVAPARRAEPRLNGRLSQAMQMSLLAAQATSPSRQLRLTLDWLMRVFGCEHALILRHEEQANALVLVAGRDLAGNDLTEISPECLDLCWKATRSTRPVTLRVVSNGRPPGRVLRAGSPEPRPMHAIAVAIDGRRHTGEVLYIDHHFSESVFTEEDTELLATIASHLPLVLETSSKAKLEVFERIADNTPGLVFQFVLYPDGRRSYRFVSAKVRSLGIEPEEARRNADALIDLIHPDDRPAFERSLARSAETLRPWVSEGRYVLPDGRVKWFHGVAHPERQPGGELLWDGVIVDITKLKRVESRVRALNLQLDSRVKERTRDLVLANQELEAFTYSVSHDLKTPLLTIRGFSEELNQFVLDEEARDLLARIQAASGRMETLIEAMLSLSRIAHQPLSKKEIDLSSMADEILDSLKAKEPKRKVEAFIEPRMIVSADETLTRILLDNLLGNAWKFTRGMDPSEIRFTRSRLKGEEVFVLQDNGTGFESAFAETIFQPFHRLHDQAEFEGSGVGLATARRIVQRHGGKIWARGARGKGATFYFSLGPAP